MQIKSISELVKKYSDAKYGKMGVAGLDRNTAMVMATMLENQYSFETSALNENDGALQISNGSATNGIDYSATDGMRWKPVSLAMVRRAVPASNILKWVPSQAIQTPVSLAYAYRFYDDLNNTELWKPGSQDEFLGYTGRSRLTLREIYNQGLGLTGGAVITDALWATVSIGVFAGIGATITNDDGTTSTVVAPDAYLAYDDQFTTTLDTTVANAKAGDIRITANDKTVVVNESFLYGAPSAVAEDWFLKGDHIASTDANNQAMRQAGVKLDTVAVYAKTRKMGASYSMENGADLEKMMGVSLHRDMVEVLHVSVSTEIDREGLWRMKRLAVMGDGGVKKVIAVNVPNPTVGATGYDQRWGRYSAEMIDTLVKVITYQANSIYQTTRRGIGNFVVVSAGVASALQFAPGFISASGYKADVNVARQVEVGKLSDGIVVYMDSDSRNNKEWFLVGYKGSGNQDGGLIFSPYMMGIQSDGQSPADFSTRMAVMSRYAYTENLLGSGRYYRYGEISGFDNLGIRY